MGSTPLRSSQSSRSWLPDLQQHEAWLVLQWRGPSRVSRVLTRTSAPRFARWGPRRRLAAQHPPAPRQRAGVRRPRARRAQAPAPARQRRGRAVRGRYRVAAGRPARAGLLPPQPARAALRAAARVPALVRGLPHCALAELAPCRHVTYARMSSADLWAGTCGWSPGKQPAPGVRVPCQDAPRTAFTCFHLTVGAPGLLTAPPCACLRTLFQLTFPGGPVCVQ